MQVQMELESSNQPKLERSRTRWTASLDKIFADLVVKQIQLGNRQNDVFDKNTWNRIRDEFNGQTDLNFNNNQLRKHLDVLRTRFHNLKSAYDQNIMDDPCYIGLEQWEDIGVQTRNETVKGKDCPIYEQLCTIFIDSHSPADGKYAQSSHYEELDKSIGIDAAAGLTSCHEARVPHYENPSSSKSIPGNISTVEKVTKNSVDRIKKRPRETQTTTSLDQDTCYAMAGALLEMVAVSRLRAVVSSVSDDKFSITNCIRALDEIQGIDQQLYFSALDLFEDPSLRETFISLKSVKIRLTWLQGKCNKSLFR